MAGIPPHLEAALGGTYQLQRELGRGGMATVYLATDRKHERQVALKVFRPELAAAVGPDRFLTEIKVTANLQHPHILPLFDSGQTGGLLYYSMPYVAGESLRARMIRNGPLAVAEAVAVAADVAAALDYAHRHGVIHRDVKPENILLHEGSALVADFGIALAYSRAGGARLTETGLSLGTPAYMSPEQAAGGRDLDARSDVYSLGTVLYEMLAGTPPFTGDTVQELVARIISDDPPSVRARRPDVPPSLADVVARALANRRENRFDTAAEFARALAEAVTPARPVRPLSGRGRRAMAGAGLVVLLMAIGGGYGLYRSAADRRWVRDVAVPEMERLMGEAEFAQAYAIALEAQRRQPDDPAVLQAIETSSAIMSVRTEPAGARVRFRGYRSADTTWYEAGHAPLDSLRVPYGHVRIRLEAAGYRTLDVGFIPDYGTLSARLVATDEPDMVWIPGGVYSTAARPVTLETFRLDRREVTNAEFRAFVEAGGYRDSAFWSEPFLLAQRPLSREGAMGRFVDRTGRPGPATWELSQAPPDRAQYPVGGVSWYEAAAYCASVGKALPTYYHWRHAAGFGGGVWDDILRFSNFGGEGPAVAGSLGGVGPFGTVDMAGNLREWVWNEARGQRHVLGGAWSDPEYLYADGDAADPWSRLPQNGFRCASYPSPLAPELPAPLEQPFFDFNTVRPVDDATFAIYRKFFEYDPTPLAARVERVDTAEHWVKEKVSYAAAYGGERVTAYVFLPRHAEPPYQTVVYMPGSAAFLIRSSENLAEMSMVEFVPRSGRALVYPVYKGSYERHMEGRPAGLARRQWTIWLTQDLQRTVDYVQSRDDLRNDALGYLGLSLGAEIAVPIALEHRFAALVLVGGAFDPQWRSLVPPEIAPWNYASRITTPVMLINGRRDFMHPYRTGQVPYFNAFDVPPRDKEFVLLESGHVPQWNEVIRHALRWYDRYLGPVP